MVGVVGAAAMNMIGGPITTAAKVTHQNMAQNDLLMNAKVVVMNASTRPQMGDEDDDGYIEPVPFVPASDPSCGLSLPAGGEGGCLPADIGAILTDPWGTSYAYCVWDHGDPASSPNRIDGEDSTSGAVLAIISAGPNKRFETPCLPYDGDPDTNDIAINPDGLGDDLVQIYTYAGAVAGSGGLWELKQNEPETAVIDKKLEIGDVSAGTGFAFDTTTGEGEFPYIKTDFLASKSGDPTPVTMVSNIALDGQWLSGDGGNEGIFVDSSGNVGIAGGRHILYGASPFLGTGGVNSLFLGVDAKALADASTAVGHQAGSNTSGAGQTAVGRQAGILNTAEYQTVIGVGAGHSNQGVGQTAAGYQAGHINTGSYQTSIGHMSGHFNTASSQTAIGANAGRQNTGIYQTVLGVSSGRDNSGQEQIAIGASAGRSNAGRYQIAIGNASGQSNTGDNLVAIGYGAGQNDTRSNQFILSQTNISPTPLIQGDFATGNVGIGTASPATTLHVNGTTRTGQIYFHASQRAGSLDALYSLTSNDDFVIGQVDGAGAGASPISNHEMIFMNADYNGALPDDGISFYNSGTSGHHLAMRIRGNGSIGIGTATPTQKLQVDGAIDVTDNRILRVATPTSATDAANKAYVDSLGGKNCTSGQVLKWNGTTWACAGDNIGMPDNFGSHVATQNIQLNGHWLSGDGDNEGVFIHESGHVQIGPSNLATTDTEGPFLSFGNRNNTDPLYISRYNELPDRSHLRVSIGDNAGNSSNRDAFVVGTRGSGNVFNEMFRVESSGRVKIGTGGPEAILHVDGGHIRVRNSLYLGISGSVNTAPDIYMTSSGLIAADNTLSIAIDGSGSGSGNFRIISGGLNTTDATNELLRVNSETGYVGIGTTTPQNLLHVAGPMRIEGNNGPILFLGNETTAEGPPARDGAVIHYIGTGIFSESTHDAVVFEKTDYNAVIPDGGFAFANRGMDGNRRISMVIRGNDRVGIGEVNPSHLLHVNGIARSTQASFATSSDLRVKEDITPLSDGLNTIMRLRPVSFHYKPDYVEGKQGTEGLKRGFIAQEVEAVVPEMVTQAVEDIGNGQTVEDFRILSNADFTPILVKAVQELKAENDALRADNDNFRRELDELKAAIGQ